MLLSNVLDAEPSRVVSVPLTLHVADAAAVMKREAVGALVVCETWGRYRGMLSERNLAVAIAQHGRDLFRRRAGELMWANAPTAAPEDTVEAAVDRLLEKGVRHLPVLEHGKVLGVLSLDGLLRRLAGNAQSSAMNTRHLAA
ncbi:CBS domain-containing protein [Phenylobacterium sp.]|uniref:CBS domain-containing protein n=1 Tax=Phenylobacterium sp. TaxID=1871053 RepID=UPI0035AE1DB3